MCLVALVLASSAASAQDFDETRIPVHGRRQDTVLYDFNGDGLVDLLNSSVDYDREPHARWLALHLQRRGKGMPALPDFLWPVHATAVALAFGNFVPEGGVEICTVAPEGVYYYPFEGGRIVEEPRKLIHARTFFTLPSERLIPLWTHAVDLSGEGLDDLILPVPDGYRVYFQTAPGRFGKISWLNGDPRVVAGRTVAPRRYPEELEFVAALFTLQSRLPRLVPADVDGDGRKDLVTIQGGVATTFFQREPEEFRSEPRWSARYAIPTLQDEAKRDTINFLQVQILDVDRDKLPDLVVTRVHGQVGLWDSLQTRIEIHFGHTGRGNYEPNLFIAIHGVSIDPQFVDLNGDGFLDCLTSRLRTDLVNQALTLGILGDVGVDYEVFQFDPAEKRYLESPVYSYPIRITFNDIEKRGAASRPLLHVTGDLTGDGRADQVRVDPKTDVLGVHPGRDRFGGGRRLIDFDPTSHLRYQLERHPRNVQFHDIDADGRHDVILQYAGQLVVLRTRGR